MGVNIYLNSEYKKNYARYDPLIDEWVKKRNSFPEGSKEREEAQKMVRYYYDKMDESGYYVDAYGSTNLLWQIGLDWQDLVKELGYDEEKVKMRERARAENLNMPVDKIPELKERIKKAWEDARAGKLVKSGMDLFPGRKWMKELWGKLSGLEFASEVVSMGFQQVNLGLGADEGDLSYFQKKYNVLMELLDLAIQKNEGLIIDY